MDNYNYLAFDIFLSANANQRHIYLQDVIRPLITTLTKEGKLAYFYVNFNNQTVDGIHFHLLVEKGFADEIEEKLITHLKDFSKNGVDGQYSSQGDDAASVQYSYSVERKQHSVEDILPNDPEQRIRQMVSEAMLETLSDVILDSDLLSTFTIYFLFSCYKSFPNATKPIISEHVYEHFRDQSAQNSLSADRIFHRVKYHLMKDNIDQICQDVMFAVNDMSWIQNTCNKFLKICGYNTDAIKALPVFLTLTDVLRTQLSLNAVNINLINYFVFQKLSNSKTVKVPVPDFISVKRNKVNSQKIPLLTYYSQSHESMFKDFFFPSFQKYLSDDFELIVLNGDQLCDAVFETGDWNKQVKEKILFVNDFIQKAISEYVVFSDVDIIFYNNIYDELLQQTNGYDLSFQNDSLNGLTNNLCSGFYCCRVNEHTKAFFRMMVNNYNDGLSDQQNLNILLPKANFIKYKALSKKFYNFSHSNGKIWFAGRLIAFPQEPIIMYHANYTIGTANKEFLLQIFTEWDNMFFNNPGQ